MKHDYHLFSGVVFGIVFRLLLDCVWWFFGGYSLGVYCKPRWAATVGGRYNWKRKEAREKGKWFDSIAFSWWFPRLQVNVKLRWPTFPVVFHPLELANSDGKNDARRYPAGVASGRDQNLRNTKYSTDCVWVVRLFAFRCQSYATMFDTKTKPLEGKMKSFIPSPF